LARRRLRSTAGGIGLNAVSLSPTAIRLRKLRPTEPDHRDSEAVGRERRPASAKLLVYASGRGLTSTSNGNLAGADATGRCQFKTLNLRNLT